MTDEGKWPDMETRLRELGAELIEPYEKTCFEAADEITRLRSQLARAREALGVIMDCFWRDGETCDERIADLKQIASDAVSALTDEQGTSK